MKIAIEKENTDRLIKDCHKIENGESKAKTKTAHIIPALSEPNYTRKPLNVITQLSKKEAKTLSIRYYSITATHA